MRSSLAVIITTFVAATTAQSNYTLPAGFNIGLVTPATLGECIEKVEVDGLPARIRRVPLHVEATTADRSIGSWCLAETNTCPPICGGAANINTCDAVSRPRGDTMMGMDSVSLTPLNVRQP
jgi:hypothetical protein